MPRPRDIEISLRQAIALIRQARLTPPDKTRQQAEAADAEAREDALPPLRERIAEILGIVRGQPLKANTMHYLIFYDIEDNKVRRLVAKYLKRKGCIRIQKSVFMANSKSETFAQIHQTLQEINEVYENKDSIILAPVNVSDVRSMKLIGQNVQVDILVDPPNTLFF